MCVHVEDFVVVNRGRHIGSKGHITDIRDDVDGKQYAVVEIEGEVGDISVPLYMLNRVREN